MPEDQVGRDEPETVEATDLIEGRRYFILPTTAGGLYRYQIHDLVRCVGFHGQAPVIEFLNKGAHFSSMTGEKLSEFQVVAAVTAAQRALGLRLGSFLLLPTWGEPPYYTLLVEEADLGGGLAPDDSPTRWTPSSAARTPSTRTGGRPSDSAQFARDDSSAGSWADFQKRRLAQSGGTVEQYKQPHLMPDLGVIDTFPPGESEAATTPEPAR